MALTLDELQTMRDALVKARASGQRAYQIDTLRYEYKTDSEMATALHDLERRIATASSSATPRVIYVP